MRTKWEILTAQVEELERRAQSIRGIMREMSETPCLKGEGEHIHCGTCHVRFETEEDFARHYLVPDERYVNLGNCPDSYGPAPAPLLDAQDLSAASGYFGRRLL